MAGRTSQSSRRRAPASTTARRPVQRGRQSARKVTSRSAARRRTDFNPFRLLGRANDLIHVAGKRSSLAHLNFHLNRIEGVADGVFWLPDDVPDNQAARRVARHLMAQLDAGRLGGGGCRHRCQSEA